MKEILKYVKDNNIKSYLTYLETEKIKEYINKKDYTKNYNDNIETLEDYISKLIQEYNYKLALENEDIEYMIELIYGCEFDIEINEDKTLNLIDLQRVYLGGVESYENFETIEYALNRLSGSYLYDYYGIEN